MDALERRPEQNPPRDHVEGHEHLTPDGEQSLFAQFAQAKSLEAYCQHWLTLQCQMIGTVSAGVVLLGPPNRGPYSPVAFWPTGQRAVQHLTEVVEQALAERRGLAIKREPASAAAGAPRHRYEIAYPIDVGGTIHGVVAMDLVARPDRELQALLRRLQWGFAWLEVLFRKEEAAREGAARKRLQQVLDLAATGVGQDRFYGAATAFVTALATRLSCDRVSLGFLRGNHTRVRAVSHSAQFGKQTNLVRAIAAAMDEALDQQAVIVFPAPPDATPHVTRAHAELARQHGSGALCSIPLMAGDRTVGALTLERSADQPFDAATVELCEGIAALAGPPLEVQRREDRWLAAKAGESCQLWLGRLIGPRHMILKLVVVVLLALATAGAVVKDDFRLSATAVLEPEIRQAAVAPFNGYVAEARARAGDVVKKGQLLCSLDDRDMRLERLRALSQQEQLTKQYHLAMTKHDAAQTKILAAQIEQAKAQLTLLEEQLSRTRILAPFDGVIVQGDLSQALGSPVERGQVLFEVAPLEAYRLILHVDERDIAYAAVGQRGQLLLNAAPDSPQPFAVSKITPISTAREGKNYFRVEATLEETPESLRPGMEGVGKIEVGRELFVWIWMRQVIDWVRLTLWQWLP